LRVKAGERIFSRGIERADEHSANPT